MGKEDAFAGGAVEVWRTDGFVGIRAGVGPGPIVRQTEQNAGRLGSSRGAFRGPRGRNEPEQGQREAERCAAVAGKRELLHVGGLIEQSPAERHETFSGAGRKGSDWKWVRGCRLKPAFRPQWNAGFSRQPRSAHPHLITPPEAGRGRALFRFAFSSGCFDSLPHEKLPNIPNLVAALAVALRRLPRARAPRGR